MKRKKKVQVLVCLLCAVFISILIPSGRPTTYEAAAIDYTNALNFFQNTGQNNGGKHIKVNNGIIYFATSAKLAGTYSSRTVYSTLGYDVTLTAGGKSVTFAVIVEPVAKAGTSSLTVADEVQVIVFAPKLAPVRF